MLAAGAPGTYLHPVRGWLARQVVDLTAAAAPPPRKKRLTEVQRLHRMNEAVEYYYPPFGVAPVTALAHEKARSMPQGQ